MGDGQTVYLGCEHPEETAGAYNSAPGEATLLLYGLNDGYKICRRTMPICPPAPDILNNGYKILMTSRPVTAQNNIYLARFEHNLTIQTNTKLFVFIVISKTLLIY